MVTTERKSQKEKKKIYKFDFIQKVQLFLQPFVFLELLVFFLTDVAITQDGHIHHHCCPLMFIDHHVRLIMSAITSLSVWICKSHRMAGSVLESLELMVQRRILHKKNDIMDNSLHPPHNTVIQSKSIFSQRNTGYWLSFRKNKQTYSDPLQHSPQQ